MTADPLYHVDGDLVPASEASVPVRDRGFRYGDAAFETVRAYGGTLFRWDAHADRLAGSLASLGFDVDLPDLDLRSRVEDCLDANGFDEAYVRASVTRGESAGFAPPVDPDPTVVVAVRRLHRGGVEGDPAWDDPARLQTARTQRVPDRALPSAAKTHNFLNSVLARIETRVSDANAALMLDADGYVAEADTANLFFVAEDALRTPSLDSPVLPGVTRATVLELAREEGLPVEEGRYAPEDVRAADEAFLTSSVRELRPVESIDGIDVGGGPVTSLLSRLYDERVERVCYADGGDVAGDEDGGTDGDD